MALQPASPEALKAAVEAVQNLDPGRPVVLDARPIAADPAEMLADAARDSTLGIDLTLFQAPALETARLVPVLSPLVLLAREFTGDLSWDPGSSPSGAQEAWTFVRGKDLGLRVIALAPAGAQDLALRFNEPELRRPVRFPIGGQRVPPPSGQVAGGALVLQVGSPGRVAVLGLDRPTAAERQGVEEKVTVSSQREIPVEEILRRLQAFEDAQNRRLEHYSATNTTSLRFQPAAGTQAIEATLQGPFFFDPKTGTDWAWETLYVNGVKWRGKTLPEIPLIQPEKAAALPLEIHFTKEYRYRLRGSDTIDGRDAWVVDFTPAGPDASGKLYQGSVWIDKKLYSRLRTRAVQVGLEGEVLSNEETLFYTPVDAAGQAAPWSAQSYMLPLRLVAQQILSVINAATIVERETRLTDVQINGPGFEEARKRVNASDVTMVRDTAKGLRYLVKDDQGERVVKEGFKASKLFGAGGLFYDDALDYPLPLAGINYFSFNFRGTGKQVNVFFGGALLTANIAEPRLFGSRFDAGANAFAIAIPLTDTIYRNGKEIKAEAVEQRPGHLQSAARPSARQLRQDRRRVRGPLLPLREGGRHGEELRGAELQHHPLLLTEHGFRPLRLPALGVRQLQPPLGVGFLGAAGESGFQRGQAGLPALGRLGEQELVSAQVPEGRARGRLRRRVGPRPLQQVSVRLLRRHPRPRLPEQQRAGGPRSTPATLLTASRSARRSASTRSPTPRSPPTRRPGSRMNSWAASGLAGTFIGPWQTVVNLDVGTPVAGPDSGFVLYVVFLKLFK